MAGTAVSLAGYFTVLTTWSPFSYRAMCRNTVEITHQALQANNTLAKQRSGAAPGAEGGLAAAGLAPTSPSWRGFRAHAGRNGTLRTQESMFLSLSPPGHTVVVFLSFPTGPFPSRLEDSRRGGKKRGRTACICYVSS